MKGIKLTRKMPMLEIALICYYHNLSIKEIVGKLKDKRSIQVEKC